MVCLVPPRDWDFVNILPYLKVFSTKGSKQRVTSGDGNACDRALRNDVRQGRHVKNCWGNPVTLLPTETVGVADSQSIDRILPSDTPRPGGHVNLELVISLFPSPFPPSPGFFFYSFLFSSPSAFFSFSFFFPWNVFVTERRYTDRYTDIPTTYTRREPTTPVESTQNLGRRIPRKKWKSVILPYNCDSDCNYGS